MLSTQSGWPLLNGILQNNCAGVILRNKWKCDFLKAFITHVLKTIERICVMRSIDNYISKTLAKFAKLCICGENIHFLKIKLLQLCIFWT